jgi:hypothetical protein
VSIDESERDKAFANQVDNGLIVFGKKRVESDYGRWKRFYGLSLDEREAEP